MTENLFGLIKAAESDDSVFNTESDSVFDPKNDSVFDPKKDSVFNINTSRSIFNPDLSKFSPEVAEGLRRVLYPTFADDLTHKRFVVPQAVIAGLGGLTAGLADNPMAGVGTATGSLLAGLATRGLGRVVGMAKGENEVLSALMSILGGGAGYLLTKQLQGNKSKKKRK